MEGMKLFRVMAGAAGLALLAAPAGAVQFNSSSTLTFDTSLVQVEPNGAGESDGTLRVRISPDGIVQGYYRPVDSGAFREVTGGVNGDQIWLDIGDNGTIHIEGTYQNGKIVGYTLSEAPQFGTPGLLRQYKFQATLASSPAN
jgi:hypothetical protein